MKRQTGVWFCFAFTLKLCFRCVWKACIWVFFFCFIGRSFARWSWVELALLHFLWQSVSGQYRLFAHWGPACTYNSMLCCNTCPRCKLCKPCKLCKHQWYHREIAIFFTEFSNCFERPFKSLKPLLPDVSQPILSRAYRIATGLYSRRHSLVCPPLNSGLHATALTAPASLLPLPPHNSALSNE